MSTVSVKVNIGELKVNYSLLKVNITKLMLTFRIRMSSREKTLYSNS